MNKFEKRPILLRLKLAWYILIEKKSKCKKHNVESDSPYIRTVGFRCSECIVEETIKNLEFNLKDLEPDSDLEFDLKDLEPDSK